MKLILRCVPAATSSLKWAQHCRSYVTTNTVTNRVAMAHRARLFEEEKQRQLKEIERIEKIEVKVINKEEEVTLMMNKGLSTPYNCAMHISELLCKESVLALLDNENLWDMHRPLEDSCTLKFLHFKDPDPKHVNNAYWRSCSFLLGYLLETAFKDEHFIELCSFPPPNIQSGSFIYDAKTSFSEWKPSKQELRCLSVAALKLASQKLNFERLQISTELAEEMFKYNNTKLEQIPSIVSSSADTAKKSLTVYKLGDFVDISKGPMISNSSLVGRFEVAGVFSLDAPNAGGKIQRIQGVSVPTQLQLHAWTFNLLVDRASKLNKSYMPGSGLTSGGLDRRSSQSPPDSKFVDAPVSSAAAAASG